MSRARRRPAPPLAETGFPPGFRARMERLVGREVEPLLAALGAPEAGLRVNSLRLSPQRFRHLAPFPLEPLAFPPEGFRVDPEAGAGRHPYHDAGLYYLQDPGAMAVGALVDPAPGERVLDLAAAPGGKATHLAARLGGRGLLVANDVHPARARELAGNLERCGATNAVVLAESPDRLARRLGPVFDRVLLDAPCSGEAMFHKSAAARSDWSPAAVDGCARRQDAILPDAAALVRPGGLLVYSTCTLSPEENEGVVARFLAGTKDYEAVEPPAVPAADRGRPEWAGGADGCAALARTLRLWPHRVAGAGHYVALLRRTGGEAGGAGDWRPPEAPADDRARLEDFSAGHLHRLPGEGGLARFGEELYRVPPGLPDLAGLRVVRPGLWLGTARRGRFEPAHALALALRAADARRGLDLPADDPRVAAYLRGETLRAEGEPGWLLVSVDGFALGWGKRVGCTVKNHYPRGLRRRG